MTTIDNKSSQKFLWFLRHGETEYNKMGIIQGAGVDSDLNETGSMQANLFHKKYGEIKFDMAFYSTLKRTKQTLQPFLDSGMVHESTELINEISWGIHEGKKHTPDVMRDYKKMISQWSEDNLSYSLPKGESASQLRGRLSQFLEYVNKKETKNILICTHGRALRCLMTIIQNEHPREMEKYSHSNTGLFLVKAWTGKYELVKQNDTSHLSK